VPVPWSRIRELSRRHRWLAAAVALLLALAVAWWLATAAKSM
jgi:hypothetical protein